MAKDKSATDAADRFTRLIFLVKLAVLCIFLTFTAAAAEEKTAFSVNGVKVTETEVQMTIDDQIRQGMFHKSITSERREKLREQVIEELIKRELLYQEAKRLNIKVDESEIKPLFDREKSRHATKKDFNKALETRGLNEKSYKEMIKRDLMVKKVLKQEVDDKVKLSEADIEKYYNENKNLFVIPEKIKLRDIFIRVQANATKEERAEKKKKAEEVLKKARAGEDFSKLAMEFSEDVFKDKGGEAGFLHLNMLDEQIAAKIMKLRAGEVSDIIEHIYGFYIFRIDEREPEKQQSYEEVKQRLMFELPLTRTREIRDEFIAGLKAAAKIEIFRITKE